MKTKDLSKSQFQKSWKSIHQALVLKKIPKQIRKLDKKKGIIREYGTSETPKAVRRP